MMQNWLKMVDFDEHGFVDFYDWSKLIEEHRQLDQMFQVYNTKTKKMEPLLNTLTETEARQTENMMNRMVQIIEHATSRDVRTMIDAEQSYFQPAIARLALAMMRKSVTTFVNVRMAYWKVAAELVFGLEVKTNKGPED
ncbi:unnamed protein product [Gongylonema pulchrum]|uniref:Proline dehydrogenase n=1 Tax=Gongylonema pulchrum TaxID=637853 RepID=A0A183DC12_9BILA|nr:unnamed protein product [Gongylonema pulchrum]